MRKYLKILILLLFGSTSIFGQEVNCSDSLKIVETYKTLFTSINNNDMEAIIEMSNDKIYCLICFDGPDFSDTPYMIEKKNFLENFLLKIKETEFYQRATKSDENHFIYENDHRSDITVLWTVYKQDELALGHEGAQFGIYFKKVNGVFKFAGIETIP
ncbi:MAG TPA: hypothetical protein VLZ83_03300 [Edaphocola sp.]|nr:hypothetical protein [Edaphocola sp.]